MLKMFKAEGEGLLKSMKTARETLKRDDEKTGKEKVEWFTEPPPYTNGQFPPSIPEWHTSSPCSQDRLWHGPRPYGSSNQTFVLIGKASHRR